MAKSCIIICLSVCLAMICIVDSKAFSKRDLGNFKKLQNRNFTDLRNIGTLNRNATRLSIPNGNQNGKNEVGVVTYTIDLNKIESKDQQAAQKTVQKRNPDYYYPSYSAPTATGSEPCYD